MKLTAVDATNPFYNLNGSDNLIAFTTQRYHSQPLVIKGPGAGAEVTAAGVLAEVISISNYLL
jgi:aspartokinase/homoserine dehydrogenase 1